MRPNDQLSKAILLKLEQEETGDKNFPFGYFNGIIPGYADGDINSYIRHYLFPNEYIYGNEKADYIQGITPKGYTLLNRIRTI